MRLCFPPSARLTQASEFAHLRREGVSTAGRYLVFSVLREGEGEARLGLITSRKIGGAVVRNRTRRRLRELFRAQRPQLVPGTWLVVIARHRVAEATWAQLSEEWQRLVRKSGILQEPPC